MVLKDILIHWDGHGDIDIGSLIELDNADERVIPFKAINLILSNSRTALVHNGEFIQHQLDVSLYHGCYNNKINYFSTQDGFALGQLLMSYRSPLGGDCCLVKPYDPVTIPDSTIIRNELDCSISCRNLIILYQLTFYLSLHAHYIIHLFILTFVCHNTVTIRLSVEEKA